MKTNKGKNRFLAILSATVLMFSSFMIASPVSASGEAVSNYLVNGDAETGIAQNGGDAETDALLAAGDQRDAHAQSLPRIWSAARSDSAAMVSAGFTAAEVGSTLASVMNRFGWSWARP